MTAPARAGQLAAATRRLLLAAVLIVPVTAAAQPAGPPRPPAPDAKPQKPPEIPSGVEARYAQDGMRTIGRLPVNVLLGMVGVWNGDNLTPALLGAVASGAAYYGDKDIQRRLSSPTRVFGRFAETGGGPIITSTVVASLFASGRVDHRHKRWRAVTYDMLDATFVNLVYTEALKRAVRRERPNGEDDKSFPSGHSSNAFTLATCFERHYGWRVSLPAYAIASAVAASRLQRNKHYLSDVVGGAAIGYVVGRSVARVNGRPLHPEEKKGVSLTPLFGPRTRGVEVALAF